MHYYVVTNQHKHNTIVETDEILDFGTEVAIDVDGTPHFYVITSRHFVDDPSYPGQFADAHKLLNVEKAKAYKNRDEARCKVKHALDKKIAEFEAMRKYKLYAEKDEEVATLLDEYLDLTAQ